MSVRPDHPTLGVVYVDATGRKFKVTTVEVGDKLGREVCGSLTPPHTSSRGRTHAYACDLPTWQAVWRDRRAPTPVSEQSLV